MGRRVREAMLVSHSQDGGPGPHRAGERAQGPDRAGGRERAEAAGDRRDEAHEEQRAALAEELATLMIDAGMQRMAARVFSHLFVDEEGALTAAELAARLRVSPGAISGAVGYLSQAYLVTRERQPGSRRERYRLQPGVLHESITNCGRILDRWSSTMRKGMTTLGPETRVGRRLAETAEFLEFLREELAQVMVRWEERQAARRAAADGPG